MKGKATLLQADELKLSESGGIFLVARLKNKGKL